MNFEAVTECTYWWPVTVRLPSHIKEDAGKLTSHEFKMRFRAIDRDAALAAREEYAALTSEREVVEHEVADILANCVDWDGVTSGGTALAFTEDNLRKALQKTWFRTAVYEAMAESLSGDEARLGN
ncbi:hypothetical protein [uncultured Tateyamaria sp.]|uniref:hypothetical protein n=1 Tax=uncultured Tateyamaria sp. TaxID=455651 RepID=UPI0026078CCE|nr:hypothetical protein [uncultured Tateyamaria sp.]